MFYKQLEDTSITYGNYVQTEHYTLDYQLINEYSTPLPDNWQWFETVQDAETYFGVEIN